MPENDDANLSGMPEPLEPMGPHWERRGICALPMAKGVRWYHKKTKLQVISSTELGSDLENLLIFQLAIAQLGRKLKTPTGLKCKEVLRCFPGKWERLQLDNSEIIGKYYWRPIREK